MNFSTMLSMVTKEIQQRTGESVSPALSVEMANQIDRWSEMYGDNIPSLNTIGIPAAVSSEIARLVTIEMGINISGGSIAEKMQDAATKFVLSNIRTKVEYGCALGGLVIKPFISDGQIKAEFVNANCFAPIGFDGSGTITECVFVQQLYKGKSIYTRLEHYKLVGNEFTVDNWAYISQNTETLGVPITLSSVPEWSNMSDSVTVNGVKKLPFGYFKMPLANRKYSSSPIGVSCFANADKRIDIANERYGQVNWEYKAKEAAVHISEDALKQDSNGNLALPKGEERLYRVVQFSTGAKDKPYLDVYSPQIRDESMYNGLNHQLRLVEFDCGLAYGTISDPNDTDKTATEIKSSRQRSYQFVSDTQKALQNALNDYFDAYALYAGLYGIDSSTDYTISYTWDDSLVIDSDTEKMTDMQLVSAGVMPKYEFRMKWNGEDEETAKKMIQAAKDESGSGTESNTNPFGFNGGNGSA